MQAADIIQKLSQALGELVVETAPGAKDPFVVVQASGIVKCMETLKNDPELAFDYLMNLAGVDYMGIVEGDPLGVVYHLYSYTHKHAIVIKAFVDRENPEIDSISSIYPAAEWQEREAFDMFGIVFKNHPDLRRILLPQGWEGHPMRKDWKEPPEILGISTQRKSLRERLKELAAQRAAEEARQQENKEEEGDG